MVFQGEQAFAKLKRMSWEKIAAGQPEIIRAHQKDEYFQTVLKNKLAGVIVSLFGKFFGNLLESECTSGLAYIFCLDVIFMQTIGTLPCFLPDNAYRAVV